MSSTVPSARRCPARPTSSSVCAAVMKASSVDAAHDREPSGVRVATRAWVGALALEGHGRALDHDRSGPVVVELDPGEGVDLGLGLAVAVRPGARAARSRGPPTACSVV